jgi:hypothetical protein
LLKLIGDKILAMYSLKNHFKFLIFKKLSRQIRFAIVHIVKNKRKDVRY